ncbi:MAG: hypothetical protein ACR2FY_13305 [Pirellulaceae bacterium]
MKFQEFLIEAGTDPDILLTNIYYEEYYERINVIEPGGDCQFNMFFVGKRHVLARMVKSASTPFVVAEDEWRNESPVQDESPARVLSLMNPRYIAHVKAAKPPNTLASIRAHSQPDELLMRDFLFSIGVPQLERSFHALVRDPEVRFETFELTTVEGKQLTRVVFECDRRWFSKVSPWRFEAFLDPKIGQMQRLVATDGQMVETYLAEYLPGAGTKPQLSALRIEVSYQGKTSAKGRTLFRNYRKLDLSDTSRFYLPHYGIPEPAEFVAKGGMPVGLYLLFAGIGLVVVSVVLRRFWRKR